nr:RNA-directed DNA polymerase, eukaryota [Tanacetum cinerariifolium]
MGRLWMSLFPLKNPRRVSDLLSFASLRCLILIVLWRIYTIWIGRYHLYANQVRFDRPHKSNSIPVKPKVPSRPPHPAVFQKSNGRVGSYANIINGVSPGIYGPSISSSPVMVLDDTCLVERDLSKHVMGKVKDFMSIPNRYTILKDEGFLDVKLSYLGGSWVLLEFDKVATNENLMNHTGVNSWFHILQNANNDFTSEERIVWVDIKDNADSSFGRKRVCIMTKHLVSILETFKIIVKGRVFMVRMKELFTWNPIFVAHKEKLYTSDDESLHTSKNHEFNTHPNEEESGDEFSSDDDADPFELYELLNRKKDGDIHESSPSLSHPPSFTPAVSKKRDEQHTIDDSNNNVVKDVPTVVSAKVMNSLQDVPVESNSEATGQNAAYNEGSILGVMEDVIRVGQAMGLGHKTKKEWVKALTNSNKLNFLAIQETKMSRVSHMDVKFLWGNSNYDFICSDSLGSSGGILCIWEASVFKKDNVMISDNFIAIYGTWLPNNAKILFVSVYAPQHGLRKKMLWDYILTILGRWNGESIIMGDFNEVRSSDERRGSCFNPYNARYFDRFISNSGLTDITLEGYAFTWSHPSASKMSKLDRFLVSDGIFMLFPSITAICLDRHISDYRPILLRDVHVDFGPTPFKFYHSWFDLAGFDEMIKHSWLSISYSNANGMIRFKKKIQDLKLIIRQWVKAKNLDISSSKSGIVTELGEIDKAMDRGEFDDATVLRRFELKSKLIKVTEMEVKDCDKKSKVKWAVEGDENSKFFHGIINKRRSQLTIRGVFVDGIWRTDPETIKPTFSNHFAARFNVPVAHRFKLNFQFHKKLSLSQAGDLE